MARQCVLRIKGEAQEDGRVFVSRLPAQLKLQCSHLALWSGKWLGPAADRPASGQESALHTSFGALVKVLGASVAIISPALLGRGLEAIDFQKKRAFSKKGRALKEKIKQWVANDVKNGGGGVHSVTNRKNVFASHRPQGVVVDGVFPLTPTLSLL